MSLANNEKLEDVIIANLMINKGYASKVMPYLRSEYFEFHHEIIDIIKDFWSQYSAFPTREEVVIELRNKVVNDKRSMELVNYVDNLDYSEDKTQQWLLDKTEAFCRCRSYSLAVIEAADKMSEVDAQNHIDSTMANIIESSKISFDTNVGLDYFDDIERRFEFYHTQEDKVSWGISEMDEISDGGISKKNIVCIMAGTNVGKSIFMCAVAANCIRQGKNVLYISMEMSENRVSERIDANLFNVPVNSLKHLSREDYFNTAEKLKAKSWGRLIIREYPTGCAGLTQFENLLDELNNKKGFCPDIVIIDYLNICCSSKLDAKKVGNSYTLIKSISEELRSLAVSRNVAVLTATQVNRQGSQATDLEMADISESFGVTFAMDMMFGLIRTEELDESHMIQIKQLKNRYSDMGKKPFFRLGFDIEKMRIYDVNGVKDPFEPSNYASTLPPNHDFRYNSNTPKQSGAPSKVTGPISSKRNNFNGFDFGS